MAMGRDSNRLTAALERGADALVVTWGWRRALAALLAGAAAALAQAPFDAFPVLFVALPALVFLLDGAVDASPSGALRRLRPAFAVGWWFGFGYFLAGLWWIGAAFTVDLAQFGWMLPFAIGGLAAGLALFMGLGTALARLLWTRGASRILALAVGLSVSEMLRGHVLTGFPWNALGYGLAAADAPMQVAALVGLEGMTFLAVVIFASPAAFLGGDRLDRAFGLAGLALFALVWGFGAWRLAGATVGEVPGVRLRVMQPAVDQWQKWRPEFRAEIMDTYLRLSRGAPPPPGPAGAGDRGPASGGTGTGAGPGAGKGLDGVTHLVWPESAFPFFVAHEAWALSLIADLLPPGTTLLTGAIRAEAPAAGEQRPRVYNAVMAIDHEAQILAAADKVHLVPFGEYLPWQDTLEAIGLRQLTHLRGGFTAGPGLTTLAVPGAPPVGPLICYEAIFPGAVVDATNRPGWLLNVTNDGWFGITPGPHQHLRQARLRAVEEGLPLVRAANTGISVVTDPYGRVRASLALGVSGTFDAALPAALPPTFYAVNRTVPFWLIAFAMMCLAIRRKAPRWRSEAD